MAAEDPEDSWPLLIRELLERLRGRADRNVRRAVVIAIDLSRGYKPAEIQARHALTPAEYEEAYQFARQELDEIRAA